MENYLKAWEPIFNLHRAYLISFAYRMTGSLAEAEDLAQDTYIECASTDPSGINNPKSWLTKICSNRSLDHLKSAYKRRETYPGVWLPDTIPDCYQPLEEGMELNETLTVSFLLLAERLSPEERAVYLLGEVFDYSFKEISDFLEKSETLVVRQLSEHGRRCWMSGGNSVRASRPRA